MAASKQVVKPRKIDSEGQYLPFPGVTVVAHVKNRVSSDSPFQAFYNALSSDPLVCEYFSLLPPSSYHMTTFNLFIQGQKSNKHWDDFLYKNRDYFQALSQYLNLSKNALHGMRITIDSLHSERSISLKVHIPDALREQIETMSKIFEDYSLSSKIPPFFHVTIAYRFKPPQDEETEADVQRRINEIFVTLFNQNRVHDIEPHTLCYFNSMLAFHPWNGASNPFAIPTLRLSEISVFSNTGKSPQEICPPLATRSDDPIEEEPIEYKAKSPGPSQSGS